ncbi:MAG: FG-GAP repeat domain-containing protein [Shimia sp.]
MRLRAWGAALCALLALPAAAGVTSAEFTDPTDRYPHGVLGDDLEWGGLIIRTDREEFKVKLGDERVFEDLEPRLWDLDGDGDNEVVVIESHESLGARLTIYDERGLVGHTPEIGTRFRWLAPLGFADFDGDGFNEIAFIDRPHLAKTLRLYRYRNGNLTRLPSLQGVTNHRIGQAFIQGGVRDCPGRAPEAIVADATWTSVLAVTYDGQLYDTDYLGPYTGPQSLRRHLSCS